MKANLNVFFLLFWACSVPALHAQVKDGGCFSLDEIRNVIGSQEAASLSRFDSFAGREGMFLLESPTLRMADGKTLPASQWVICGSADGKSYEKKSVRRIDRCGEDLLLCWVKCNDPGETEEWAGRLKKKYGVIRLDGGEDVVPAKWVSDTLYFASYPTSLRGLWPVETCYPACSVKQGKVSAVVEEGRQGLCSSFASTLRTWVMDLRLDLFSVLDGNGRRQREAAKAEMMLLGYEVNRPSPSESVWPDGLSFLVWVKPGVDGRLDCDIVEPASLTAGQQAYADELCAAVRKVDNLCVPVRRTLHGKVFPGMLLRVRKDTPCWTFGYEGGEDLPDRAGRRSEATARKHKIPVRESYGQPVFSLSHFSGECDERTYPAVATWAFVLEQDGKEAAFGQQSPATASFEITKDPEEVYDCSVKTYRLSADGVSVDYAVYAGADRLVVSRAGTVYEISTIDGGCDVHLGQLRQHFHDCDGRETLVLTVIDDMILKEKPSPGKTGKGKSLILKRGSSFAVTVSYNAD